MFDRNVFYSMRCVRTVIEIVDQVPGRWYARSPVFLDESSVALLLLWSWLRFESDFLTRCLEDLGVDLAALANQVDALLKEQAISKETPAYWQNSSNPQSFQQLRELTLLWLNRATDESDILFQNYVGMEHLLLAFLRVEGSPIAQLFSQLGIDRKRLNDAILEILETRTLDEEKPLDVGAFDLHPNTGEGFLENLGPPVGMPRRFSMAILMSWVTLFAVVFSLLKWLNTPPEIFGILTLMMFFVGIGQMWLFGGEKPRAASFVTGAIALSAEVFILNITTGYFSNLSSRTEIPLSVRIIHSFSYIFVCLPLGAFFGYLTGGLTAGMVLLLERFEKRRAEKDLPELEEDTGETQ